MPTGNKGTDFQEFVKNTIAYLPISLTSLDLLITEGNAFSIGLEGSSDTKDFVLSNLEVLTYCPIGGTTKKSTTTVTDAYFIPETSTTANPTYYYCS